MDALTGCSSDFVESTHEVIRDWSGKATSVCIRNTVELLVMLIKKKIIITI